MIYIHHIDGYSLKPGETISDLKSALKESTGKVFRRTNRYIQLALLGAQSAFPSVESDMALFLASGEGNLSVFNRLRDQRNILHLPPRPVDFINLLGNTAGFYVAQYLGLSGKNLFLSHHGFPAQMAMILAENNLILKKQNQILLGGVDEYLEPVTYTKKFLGICDDTVLGEGSNWMIVNTVKDGALAAIDIPIDEFSEDEVLDYLGRLDTGSKIAFGMRIKERSRFLEATAHSRFDYESDTGFYETLPFYVMRKYIEQEQGKLTFVDAFEGRYRLINLSVFG